jgi:hypothetical protein
MAAIGEAMVQPLRGHTVGNQFVLPTAVWIAQAAR